MEEHHLTRTRAYPGGFRALCDCGYVGRLFEKARDAANDGDEHVVTAARSE
jgi:hypothetical protein